MSKVLIFIFTLSLTLFIAACGSASESNVNTNQTAVNGNLTVIDNSNLPEGLSASPVPPSSNTTPGIPPPGAANTIPKGTPTPGIPDPAELRKPFKPGATPTPGIPSPEELRRQMNRPATNVNAPLPAGSDTMMMKGRKSPRPVNRPE